MDTLCRYHPPHNLEYPSKSLIIKLSEPRPLLATGRRTLWYRGSMDIVCVLDPKHTTVSGSDSTKPTKHTALTKSLARNHLTHQFRTQVHAHHQCSIEPHSVPKQIVLLGSTTTHTSSCLHPGGPAATPTANLAATAPTEHLAPHASPPDSNWAIQILSVILGMPFCLHVLLACLRKQTDAKNDRRGNHM